MLRGRRIEDAVKLLEERQAELYHACQYRDLVAYLNIGGIPSRACMEATGDSFTSFDTDDTDRQYGVWDKVFLNLSDFGTTFARDGYAVPNPFGPIVFHLQPGALREGSDVAICLRSAGAAGFDREAESLSTLEEVDGLFLHPVEAGYPRSVWVKYASQLKEDFDLTNARDPEISCSVNCGYISFEYVTCVVVDPYDLGSVPLVDHVRKVWSQSGQVAPVQERKASVGRSRYAELATLVATHTPPLGGWEDWDVSDGLKQWANGLEQRRLEYQFKRYAEYLRDGTLRPIKGRKPR